ncbi:MAG: hypothetical protein QOF02_3438 [Blastocatellia bacterium]|nr:hypothetical protein [Blastocatellia bacterium]
MTSETEQQAAANAREASLQTRDEAQPVAVVQPDARPSVCETILLDDVPESKDAFSDQQQNRFGPHQIVAKAIADMINAPASQGISIGLEGSWGSGKTTVIKLLGEIFKDERQRESEQITLISFDAWAHEGDSLRRTFLEKMIKHLQKKNWVDCEKWDKELEKIANRKDTIVTKEFPTVSNFGKVIGLSLLLVPLGGALFGQALREPVTFTYTGIIAWRFIFELLVGLCFSLAPLLILILRWNNKEDILQLVINKAATETRTETERTPTATSIEFEDYFKKLMGDALKDETHRVVLVLDNLDRVDSKEALSIWSTLQTFMQHKQDNETTWYKRLWTLVLYDPKALSLLWEDKGGAQAQAPPPNGRANLTASAEQLPAEQAQNELAVQQNVEARNGSNAIATSFIDKSFQIRFEVSPPVPSDWQDFLLGRLSKAFPGHSGDDAEFHSIYRVLSIDRVLAKLPTPTIRELKLYVNQIGALHRQLVLRGKCAGPGSSFPLSLLAYYVLLRRRRPNVDIAEGVLRKELPEEDFEGLLGEQVGDKLAALHYNVEISLARQVILGPPIKAALQEGKRDELILYADNPRAFWKVLGDIIDKEWAATESVSISKAASSLDDPKLLGHADQFWTRRVVDKLGSAAAKITSWLPLDAVRADGIVSLLNIVRKRELAATLLDRIAGDIIGQQNSEGTLDISLQSWVEKLRLVLAKVSALGWGELYEQNFIEPLAQKIRGDAALPNKQLTRLLETLFELSRPTPDTSETGPKASQTLRSLVSERHLSRQFHLDDEDRNNSARAWFTFLTVRDDPKAALPLLFPSPETNPDAHLRRLNDFKETDVEMPEFTALLVRYDEWEMLFKMLEADNAYESFVLTNLSYASEYRYENLTIAPASFLKHWQLLQQKLDQGTATPTPYERLAGSVARNTNLTEEVIKEGFQIERAKLYSTIEEVSADNAQFRDWLRTSLQSLDLETWEAQLWLEGELLELVNSLAAGDVEFDSSSPYEAALLNYATAILNKSVRPTHPWNNLAGVINHGESRTKFRSKLDKAFIEQITRLKSEPPPVLTMGHVPPIFFEIFGNEILKDATSDLAFSAIQRLLPTLIDKRERVGLQWFAGMLETQPQTVEASWTKSSFQPVKEQLWAALSTETEQAVIESLARISNALQLFRAEELARFYKNLIDRYAQTRPPFALVEALQSILASDEFFLIHDDGKAEVKDIARQMSKLKLMKPPEQNRELLSKTIKEILESYIAKMNPGPTSSS